MTCKEKDDRKQDNGEAAYRLDAAFHEETTSV